MKKLVALLFLVISIGFMFSSCQQEEGIELSQNQIEAIKAKMVNAPTPTKEEVATSLSATDASIGESTKKSMLRSSDIEENFVVEIFPLGKETYEVYGDFAIKNFIYYEINQNGYRQKMITLRQFFTINDGEIDTNSYYFRYEIGCPWSREFRLNCGGNISRITHFFHFDDGKQFAYYGESNNINLPPIANGRWQLIVRFDDNDLSQEYQTELVNYDGESNVINLKLEIKDNNIVSRIKVHKELMQGATSIYLRGVDKSGSYTTSINIPVLWDDSMPEYIYFSAPFIIDVAIMKTIDDSWSYWYVNLGGMYMENGVLIYQIG